MTLKYLLDTNILSEDKRSNPNQNVIENIRLR
jgi:predicted nucleic acid-binding protein